MTNPAEPDPAGPADDVEAPPQPAPNAAPNAGPSARRLDPLAIVVAVVAFGVLVAALHHPRDGMYIVCGGVGAGAVLRLLLTPAQAGMLVVRKRRFDVIVLASFALAIGILAAVTPFPAGQG